MIHPEIEKRGIPDDHAISFVSWDLAVIYAESIGKRLPDEVEYEFAATAGGRFKFPWGNNVAPEGEWTLGPVGEPAFDHLDPPGRVMGLYSNVAEWTSTWGVFYPTPEFPHLQPDPAGTINARIVRGGPSSMLDGTPQPRQALDSPRGRISLVRVTGRAGVGFRCARSVRPRLKPEDFIRIIP